MKLSEAITRFSQWKSLKCKSGTNRSYVFILRQFALFCRNCEIESITLGEVMNYFNLLKDIGWDDNSFIPRAAAIRNLFEFFSMQGIPVLNPALIPIPNPSYKLPRIATQEEYEKLLNIIPENSDPRHIRNKAIINLLWDTGARNGEICSLDIEDLDLLNKKAIIKTEKSQGRRPIREIFWTEKTNNNILKWLARRQQIEEKRISREDNNAVFISLCTNVAGRRLDVKGVGAMLRNYSWKAKIPTMNAHSFRHHMGHQIVERGGCNSDVSNILGHSDLKSSYIYTLMTNVELHNRHRQFVGE